jgi:hypothetical protein
MNCFLYIKIVSLYGKILKRIIKIVYISTKSKGCVVFEIEMAKP